MLYPRKRPKSFGLMLRQFREVTQLTQEQFAYEIGADISLIQAVESSHKFIPPNLLVIWASTLRVDPQALLAMYLNCVAQKICLDAGLPYLFKVEPTQELAEA